MKLGHISAIMRIPNAIPEVQGYIRPEGGNLSNELLFDPEKVVQYDRPLAVGDEVVYQEKIGANGIIAILVERHTPGKPIPKDKPAPPPTLEEQYPGWIVIHNR